MRYIIVDFEMNKLDKQYKEERKICCQEIIEIGAVMLNDRYQEISRFRTYVKPQYAEEIRRNITRLTGITTEMVAEVPIFSEAMKQFTEWCFSFEGECQVQAWSDSDLQQMLSEIALKKYKVNENQMELIENWNNFQDEYIKKIGFERVVSLEKALYYAGLDFEGQQHDALSDAANTAELLKIVRNQHLFEEHLQVAKEALETKSLGNTLGSMFEFSGLLETIA